MKTLTKTARINTRIEPWLKNKGDEIFASIGLKSSDAITMFYHQVVMHKWLPFEAKVPNKETIKAINEDLVSATRFSSVNDLMNDLDA